MNVVFVGGGRLGNQIFQYAAIRRLFGPEAVVWSPSLRSIQQVFEDDRHLKVVLPGRYPEAAIRRVLVPTLIRPLFRTARLGAYCKESIEKLAYGGKAESGRVEIKAGLSSKWAFVDGGYYQNLSDLLSPTDFMFLEVKVDLIASAQEAVKQRIQGRRTPKIVMHVRRGDYVGYSSYGLSDVVLPAAYYEKAGQMARRHCGGNSEILIVSDDPDWCERELKSLRPFSTIFCSEAMDFTLLTLFPIVVVSNSTFSLAAACIGKNVEVVIGPTYWFGHQVGEWYPPRIEARDSRFTYV
jgi:hypothetical protein